ncbi:MAG: ribonuclease J [Clostridiales bacterium]|nr:ribonuclease J [Clostridiales bacterium]
MRRRKRVTTRRREGSADAKRGEAKPEGQNGSKPEGRRGTGRSGSGHGGDTKRSGSRRGGAKSESAAKVETAREGALEIIPIGGLGEIGKNMTAFRYGGDILLVDCGLSFPDNEMLGIDVVIPEMTFIEENSESIKGVILTHGHEDHIGAVPYLLQKVRTPIYGTRLTVGLIDSKLQEHGLKGDFRRVEAGEKLKIGKFRVETFGTTHSVADSLALTIETPAGRVFHTGDFKIDYTPIYGEPMDFQKLAEVGSRGIDLMLCDSTNALRKGHSESEMKMWPILDEIFSNAKSRIITATFSSNVHRIQTIINMAVKYKRKVALSGRSMLRVIELAAELGYISIPQGTLVDLDDIKGVPDKKLVIITTGSQGEPMSALTRMAAGDHRSVKIQRGDTVILSSTPIPGNEKTVAGIVNSLLALEANVIYSDIADIHVSGHASQEEIKVMISLLRPTYYMPVHGENKHLLQNASIAESLGMKRDHIIVAKNGNVVEMDGGRAQLTKRTVPSAAVFVDGLGVGDIGTSVLRERKQLSESGLIIVAMAIDSASGFAVAGPEVISRGFVYEKMSGDILEELRRIAEAELEAIEREGVEDRETMKARIRNVLKGYITERTHRHPVILPIIMEA